MRMRDLLTGLKGILCLGMFALFFGGAALAPAPAAAQITNQNQEEQIPAECQRAGGGNTCFRLARGAQNVLLNNSFGCFFVDNNSSQDYFIPLGTALEFNAFISAASSLRIAVDRCCPSRTVTIGPASDGQTFEITLPIGRDQVSGTGEERPINHVFNLSRQDCTTHFDNTRTCNTVSWTETFIGTATCDSAQWVSVASTADQPPAANPPPYIGPKPCGDVASGTTYWVNNGQGSRAANDTECPNGAGNRMLNWTVQVEMQCLDGVATPTGNTRNTNLNWTGTCAPEPVDGACGPASGQSFAAAPTSGFCAAGSFSGVTGSGPWNWICYGFDGGQSVNCAASASGGGNPGGDNPGDPPVDCSLTAVPAQTYTIDVANDNAGGGGCPTNLWCVWDAYAPACGGGNDNANKFCVTGQRNGSVSLGFNLGPAFQSLPPDARNLRVHFGVRGGGAAPDLSNALVIGNPNQSASTNVQQGSKKNYNYSLSYNGSSKRAVLTGGATGWGSCDGDPSCGGKGGWAYPRVTVAYDRPAHNTNPACVAAGDAPAPSAPNADPPAPAAPTVPDVPAGVDTGAGSGGAGEGNGDNCGTVEDRWNEGRGDRTYLHCR